MKVFSLSPLGLRKKNLQKYLPKNWLKFLAKVGLGFLVFLALLFIWYSKDLPTPGRIARRAAAQSTKIMDRNGKILYAIYGEKNRIIIPFSEMPDSVKLATIAIEDKNFYRHFGVDFKGVLRAAIYNLTKKDIRQGGSTITQQFVKNALLSPKRTWTRKIKELILSIELEIMYSKDKILEMYLNEIPYGSNAYGIEAAAKTYFSKSAKELSLAQSALLASLPRAPTYYSPYGTHTENLFARQGYILDRMVELKMITKEEAEKAKAEKIIFSHRREAIEAPHFVMYVREILAERYGEKMVSEGGLQVTTTLDLDLQKKAQEAIDNWAPRNLKVARAKNAALIALDPKTGQILSMVGSKDYFDISIDGNVNINLALRQPGSAFKPVVYATAFKGKWGPGYTLFDLPTDFGGGYKPDNYDGNFRGPISIRQALANSINLPAVKMLGLIGIPAALETAKNMGITTLNQPSRYGLSLVLGGGEIKMLELAGAYAILAGEGKEIKITPILKITDSKGKILEEYKEVYPKKQIIAREIAYQISDILSDNEARAAVFGTNSRLYIPGRRVAAKTGTTDAFRDAWTFGYTPSLVSGVWVGNNDNTPMIGTRGAGAMAAAPIWHDFMVSALERKKEEWYERPETIKDLSIDWLTNKLPSEGSPTRTDIFAPWQVPEKYADEGEVFKIDKISGKLATDLTPLEMIEERRFKVIHSEKPENPAWEEPVRAWARDAGYLTGGPPTEYDDVHTQANLPSIQITSPSVDQIISGQFTITASPLAPAGIKEIGFYLDGVSIGQANSPPHSLTYDSNLLSAGLHTISVTLLDQIGFKAKGEVKFQVKKATLIPPTISNITVSSLTSTQAVISWQTNEPADSAIEYGLSSGIYPLSQIKQEMVTNHSINLTGLSPGKKYYYKIRSKNASGLSSSSGEGSFTTPS